MSALATDLPIGMNSEEDSGSARRAELSLSNQLSVLYGVLRVLGVRVWPFSHHSSPPSGSSSSGVSSAASS